MRMGNVFCFSRRPFHRFPDDIFFYGRMQTAKRLRRQFQRAVFLLPSLPLQPLLRFLRQIIIRFQAQLPAVYNMFPGFIRNLGLQIGKDGQADFISRVVLRQIRLIRHIGKIFLPQPCLYLLSGKRKKGAYDDSPFLFHASQTAKPAPSDQLKQNGLRIVIHMMGDGDFITAACLSDPFKRSVPGDSPCFLHGTSLSFCICGNIHGFHAAGHIPSAAELFDKISIPLCRFFPNGMIHMHRRHRQVPALF